MKKKKNAVGNWCTKNLKSLQMALTKFNFPLPYYPLLF